MREPPGRRGPACEARPRPTAPRSRGRGRDEISVRPEAIRPCEAAVDHRPKSRLPGCLVQGMLEQGDRFVGRRELREEHECLRAPRAALGPIEDARPERPGTRPFACRLVGTRSGERPAPSVVGRGRRREPECVLGELGRHSRDAAKPGAGSWPGRARLPRRRPARHARARVCRARLKRVVDNGRDALVHAPPPVTEAGIEHRRRASGARSASSPLSRSITWLAAAGSSASPETPARARSDSAAVPSADASPSASRVRTGSAAMRASRSSSSVAGTGSGASGSASSPSACATSSAKNGFPSDRSWIRSRVCRGNDRRSRSRRTRCSAPALSGPT